MNRPLSRQPAVKLGRRQASSVPSCVISARSQTCGPRPRCPRRLPGYCISFLRSASIGRKPSGRRCISGNDSGLLMRRLQRRWRIALSFWMRSIAALSRDSSWPFPPGSFLDPVPLGKLEPQHLKHICTYRLLFIGRLLLICSSIPWNFPFYSWRPSI